MSERLLSVGLDVGTTSTQMVVSEIRIENRAGSFSVPEMTISSRKVRYKSPIHFTPLVEGTLIDSKKLRAIVEEEYQNAGILPGQVDTGAVIVTGETSRKENAKAVLEALSQWAGAFVVATAGPDLEAVLAARGSGAVEESENSGKRVLHMDIGGGTSNLCLIEAGKILRTGCLNVGGRLIRTNSVGGICYVSPALAVACPGVRVGMAVAEVLPQVCGLLTQALEMAAGLRTPTALLDQLMTRESEQPWAPPEGDVTLSFSGGVADCIRRDHPVDAFGDLGPSLGRAIRASRLCQGAYLLQPDAIRATVIGAGCHATQLSGSTVFHQNVRFPLKNLPVARGFGQEGQDGAVIHAFPGLPSPSYAQVAKLAQEIIATAPPPYYLCMEADMAKALGQAMAVRLPGEAEILCIDRVRAGGGSYLDIAAPVAGAMPLVVKTLVFGRAGPAPDACPVQYVSLLP